MNRRSQRLMLVRDDAAAPSSGVLRMRVMSRAELDSAAVLDAFAEAEERRAAALDFRRMAERENEHARRWALRLYEARGRMPPRTPSWLARLLASAARRFGPTTVAPIVSRLQRWHHRWAAGH